MGCFGTAVGMYTPNTGEIPSWREAGAPVPELCRKHGMSNASFYKWRSKYGGMDVSNMKRLKELEQEIARLKKMYAEEKLKAEIISEALEKKW